MPCPRCNEDLPKDGCISLWHIDLRPAIKIVKSPALYVLPLEEYWEDEYWIKDEEEY